MSRIIDVRRLAVVVFVAAIALTAFLLVQNSGTAMRDAELLQSEGAEAQEGALAPDFEASTLTGARVRLSDYRGQAVVLNFWATWCKSCLAEIPDLERVGRERSDQGLVVLGVNVGENAERAERFLRELGATYTSFLDPGRNLTEDYRIQGLPVTVFIDQSGQIVKLIFGELSYEIFDRFARVALGEENVPGIDDPLPLRPLPPVQGDEEG